MGKYDPEIQMALDMIADYGQEIEWKQTINTITDNKKWLPTTSYSNLFKTNICFVPLRLDDMQTLGYIKNEDIPKGVVKGLMGKVNFIPSLNDTITRNGKVLNIDSINIVSPNGEIVLHTIIFKD